MTQQTLLDVLICVAFVLAPVMTKTFFLSGSRAYSLLHVVALTALALGAALDLSMLALVWPLFCVVGFLIYLARERKLIFSIGGLARCLPFVFSLISSLWFAAGVLDLRLLGYDPTFSFYAALHGSFLGWLFVGCLAHLSKRESSNGVYLWACYTSFVFFLLIAFGIDGVPFIKRVGAVGFSVMIPVLIGRYAFNLPATDKLSFRLSMVSLVSIVLSMTLALSNEFWAAAPRTAFGLPIMVSVHGFLNAIFVVPCFFLAIRFQRSQGLGWPSTRS